MPHIEAGVRRSAGSRPGAGKYRPERPRQDAQVEAQAPLIDVLEIEAHPLVEVADAIASAHLPEAGDARFECELSLVPQLVSFELVPERGPRPDQAHVALEHAPELRQLVQAVLPQEL